MNSKSTSGIGKITLNGGIVLKKIVFTLVLLVMFCAFVIPARAVEIEISSGAAVLMDLDSGRVLYSKNADQQMSPGGLNKIMTGLLAAEKKSLDDVIKLPIGFTPVPGSNAGLKAGDSRTVEALLYAMILHYSNNAAQALAIGVSDSEGLFVDLMNRRSAELGMTNTNWFSSYGLSKDDSVTTAYDLALLTRAAMKNPVFAEIMGTGYVENVPWGEGKTETFTHIDRDFLRTYKSFANGVRTADRSMPDYCMVASGEKNGIRLVAVIMNGGSNQGMYEEMAKLLDYGFSNYSRTNVGSEGEKIGSVKVSGGSAKTVDALLAEDVYILHKTGDVPVKSISLPEVLTSPIGKGDVIGSVTFTDGDYEVTVDVLAAENVKRNVFWELFKQAFKRIFSVWVK